MLATGLDPYSKYMYSCRSTSLMCVAVARHRIHPHVPRQALHRLTLHSAAAATSSTFSTWASGCASAAMAGGGAGGGGCASSPHSLGNRSRGGNRGGGSGSCRVPAGSSPVCPRAHSAAGEYALPKPWNGWLWRTLSRLRLLARLLRALPPNTHSALNGAVPVRLRCTYSVLPVRL